MPLDGHAHLVSQGWSGKGAGLRHGAIAKPVTVVQKKTLAGIGKDRDEAFPFWDHVFQAAAVSIQLKVHKSDDGSDSEESSTPGLELKRTSTGIISNRRPTTGTPALSGATTPSESQISSSDGSGNVTPRLSIMAAAKQQAARRMLYSMFYRGPVLSTEEEKAVSDDLEKVAGPSSSSSSSTSELEKNEKRSQKSKKRKADKDGDAVDGTKREKKRRKQESKAQGRGASKKARNGKVAASDSEGDEGDEDTTEAERKNLKAERSARKVARAERRKRKEERRARREERRRRKTQRAAAKTDLADLKSDSENLAVDGLDESETMVDVEQSGGSEGPKQENKTVKRTRRDASKVSSKDKMVKKEVKVS